MGAGFCFFFVQACPLIASVNLTVEIARRISWRMRDKVGLCCRCVTLGASWAKSHHSLTVADLGLFRRQPQQNSRGLLLSSTSFGPRASGAPEDSHMAKH